MAYAHYENGVTAEFFLYKRGVIGPKYDLRIPKGGEGILPAGKGMLLHGVLGLLLPPPNTCKIDVSFYGHDNLVVDGRILKLLEEEGQRYTDLFSGMTIWLSKE